MSLTRKAVACPEPGTQPKNTFGRDENEKERMNEKALQSYRLEKGSQR